MRFDRDFDERRVLFHDPRSTIRFPRVPSAGGATFRSAAMMDPAVEFKRTDGVTLEVRCTGGAGEERALWTRAMGPTDGWAEIDVSLEACSQPSTQLILVNACDPVGDCRAARAGWATPHVRYLRPAADASPSRLAILISIDTLRANRLHAYGNPRDTSPNLDDLARQGVRFERAIAASPWTVPSHATMLSSLTPLRHGATAERALSGDIETLAEAFLAAGWRTAGFVDSTYLSRKRGFGQGFGYFDEGAPPTGDYRRTAPVVRERLLDWLDAAGEEPLFLFWHIMDVHGPYWASEPDGGAYRRGLSPTEGPDPELERLKRIGYHKYLRLDRYRSLEDLIAAYDEGLRTVDAAIGVLFERLQAAGLYDDALIIVTSDHGESLLDHGVWVGHGIFLTDDELQVPLIVKLPRGERADEIVSDTVGVIDIAPTMLALLGVEPPSAFEGIAQLQDGPATRRALIGESSNSGAAYLELDGVRYVEASAWPPEEVARKHLKPMGDVDLRLGVLLTERLLTAPGRRAGSSDELEDLNQRRLLLASYRAGLEKAEPGEEVELNEEERSRLRALGYGE